MSYSIHICTRESMHPYNCGYEEGEEPGPLCRHCTGTKDETHDPDKCYLCHFFDENWEPAK